MRARTALVAAACLASACQPGENIDEGAEAKIVPVATDQLTTATTGADPAPTTTTAVPEEIVAVTTTLPILCAELPHPRHHDYCPIATSIPVLRQQTREPVSQSSTLASIRACESGGDYTTDTGNGYYGAYQFHPGTWASVGGTGNPAHASPSEQDMRAQMMIDAGRRGEWPNC